MAASEPPQWLLTVDAKRKLRDDAIQKYLDGQNLRSESAHLNEFVKRNGHVEHLATIDSVGDVVQAIASSVVTASQLLRAYIHQYAHLGKIQ